MSWSGEDVVRVTELYQGGKKYSEIADIYGVTKNAIAGLLFRKRPPTKPTDYQQWPERPSGGCRYIDGEPGTRAADGAPGWRWCGAPRLDNSSYCAEHDRRCRRSRDDGVS